jgi:hypothetical protein
MGKCIGANTRAVESQGVETIIQDPDFRSVDMRFLGQFDVRVTTSETTAFAEMDSSSLVFNAFLPYRVFAHNVTAFRQVQVLITVDQHKIEWQKAQTQAVLMEDQAVVQATRLQCHDQATEGCERFDIPDFAYWAFQRLAIYSRCTNAIAGVKPNDQGAVNSSPVQEPDSKSDDDNA